MTQCKFPSWRPLGIYRAGKGASRHLNTPINLGRTECLDAACIIRLDAALLCLPAGACIRVAERTWHPDPDPNHILWARLCVGNPRHVALRRRLGWHMGICLGFLHGCLDHMCRSLRRPHMMITRDRAVRACCWSIDRSVTSCWSICMHDQNVFFFAFLRLEKIINNSPS
jgi:hypothetical protein